MAGSSSLSACLPAPRGNYVAGEGNDGFTPCDPGTYQDQEGAAACKVPGMGRREERVCMQLVRRSASSPAGQLA